MIIPGSFAYYSQIVLQTKGHLLFSNYFRNNSPEPQCLRYRLSINGELELVLTRMAAPLREDAATTYTVSIAVVRLVVDNMGTTPNITGV